MLFKDEVRRVGRELGMPEHLITRHPFRDRGWQCVFWVILLLKKYVFCRMLMISLFRDCVTGDCMTRYGRQELSCCPLQSVGVMGDERTYERAVALRAVTSTDAMTADWAHLPYEFLGKVSNDIINKVKGVNRVTYDISSKPPSTIEWE